MITKTLTGLTLTDYKNSLDLPYRINDTFFCGSKIHFNCLLSTLNSLLSTSINSTNIVNFKLLVRICFDINGANISSLLAHSSFNLNSNNLINSNLIVDISQITNIFDDENIINFMSSDEIYNLYKPYKIIFRIYSGDLNNLETILPTDIVQDINFVLNTTQSGPYDVGFKDLDVLNPEIFNEQSRISYYTSNPCAVGMEHLRIFYPENLSENVLAPLVVCFHGNYQYVEQYDSFLSHMASYGYVAISYPIDQDNITPIPGFINVLKTLDHLKNNISIIENGKFENIFNFQKLNFMGHSRGGDLTELIIMALRAKNGTHSKIQNISFSYSDVKCGITIGRVTSCTFADDGLFAAFGNIGLTANSNTEKYLKRYIDKPMMNIVGKTDGQAGPEAQDFFMQIGFDETLKRNTVDKIVISVTNSDHDTMTDSYCDSFDVRASPNSSPILKQRIETNHGLNYNDIHISECKTQMIQFLSMNNFLNYKLKKLKYFSRNKRSEKLYFKDKYPAKEILYTKNSDVKYFLDDFFGITMSYAGITGCTFTNIAGITYDYAIDSSYRDLSTISTPYNDYTANVILDLRGLRFALQASFPGDWLTTDDPFNGILDATYKGLFIPIQSNFLLGYTFSNGLTLDENNYFGIKGILRYFTPATAGNTMDAHFTLSLKDGSNEHSELSSRMYSNGFEKNNNASNRLLSQQDLFNMHSAVPSMVYFRAGDFQIKNPNINLQNINEITLMFGPDHGSTFAHVVLDEFVVMKEL